MSELKTMAWLVTGGTMWADRVFIDESEADNALSGRDDRSRKEELCLKSVADAEISKFLARVKELEQQLAEAEKVVRHARAANSHYNEFGPEYGFYAHMDSLHKALNVVAASIRK